ncbi:ABC transporter ATP-binding protein [Ructibacterium gallinarum]|uniref:ABC transporter ATP-binding protein n=1 Tax=Ructibacterium gallinarum TaxID=2779355 RepID=A0A9D5R8I4_9FIRM|nr:ABC transporter ATP-binding protein [Ructibacterium gallinarum]MBE5039474.1 ABC transporter ATP-binding protein [Ructibacterium gallinarum]
MPVKFTSNEKPKDRKKVLKRLWSYLCAQKWMMLAAVILSVSSNLLALVGPMLSGRAIDAIGTVQGGTDFRRVFFYCGLMTVFYLVSSGLSYILSVLMIRFSQKIVFRMRKDVFDKLTELPVKYFDTHQAGDIISRISYDIDTINASLSNDLLQIATSAITVIGSLLMMILISPVMVLVFAVTIPVSILFTRYRTKKVRPLFHLRSVRLGELNGFVEEVISGQRTTKVYHQESTMLRRFDQKNNIAVDAYYNADYYGSVTGPSVNFINNISLALTSVFGALLYLADAISLGNLSSFVLYSRKFSGPINEMANIISELQSACAAAERVFRLIDEEPEPKDAEDAFAIYDPCGNVDMEHVRFGYEPNKVIIHDLNLQARSGNLIAVVGPTGAGKTTIINLLMRFYDPNSGRIMLDGHNIMHLTRKSLRLSYAMVLQDTWLFYGTVYDNIAYGKKDASREDVIRAAKAARIHDYIMGLPEEYDTVLSEEGMNISQGQKQLLTIARAMLLDANMLILDEATSNVDTRTEIYIQEAMRNLMRGKTCFVIAHRLSTIQNADTILVVQQGEIVEQGNHAQLLEKGGVYAAMYRSQFN